MKINYSFQIKVDSEFIWKNSRVHPAIDTKYITLEYSIGPINSLQVLVPTLMYDYYYYIGILPNKHHTTLARYYYYY